MGKHQIIERVEDLLDATYGQIYADKLEEILVLIETQRRVDDFLADRDAPAEVKRFVLGE